MIRSWGKVTLGAAAVPWFGDALAAAFNPPSSGTGTIQVASTTRYRQGDKLLLGAGSASQQLVNVQTIVDATHMTVYVDANMPLKAQANGAIIALSIECFRVRIQGVDGATGTIWLGTDNTVTNAGGGTAFYQLQKVAAGSQPNAYVYDSYQGVDALRTSDGWLAGTAADSYVISAEVN